MPNRTIHAAIFDLWGTLIYDLPERGAPRRRARLEGMARVLREAGTPFTEDDIAQAIAAVEPRIEAIHAAERDLSAGERLRLIVEALQPGLAQALPPTIWDRLQAVEAETFRTHLPLVKEGAREALERARAFGLGVALVSNTGPTPGAVLREALQRLGLADFFDAWIWSDEVRLWKPSPAIYRLATEALGVRPEHSIFLGDTPETDILGALRAGMWVIQVGEHSADSIHPHARISSPAEFWAAVAALDLVPEPPPLS